MHRIFVLQYVYFMPLHVSSTAVLIIRRSKLYYKASGIITPIGGRPLQTGGPPTGVMIPDSVSYNFDLLMMSICLKRMKIIGWRAKIGDRQEWNRIVEQTETHPGL